MTAPPYSPPTTAPDTEHLPAAEHETACPACAHPLAQHDPIGVRFCLATATGAFDRGCVCRVG